MTTKAPLSRCAIPAIFLACLLRAPLFAATPDSTALAAFHASACSVAGWTEEKDRFHSFGTKELFQLIDGGAVEYEKPGLIGGITFDLSGPDKKLAEFFIEDFGTPSKAKSMVKQKRRSASEPKGLSGTKAGDAFTDEVIGGCVAYGYFKGFYFELSLTGYDSGVLAAVDAKTFLKALTNSPAFN
jgi:hypothetical protein